MPTISIWGRYRHGGSWQKPEVVDRASSLKEAARLVSEYKLAFGQSWKIWSGPRQNEPAVPTSLEEMYAIKNRR